jgi:hypothetical protein
MIFQRGIRREAPAYPPDTPSAPGTIKEHSL